MICRQNAAYLFVLRYKKSNQLSYADYPAWFHSYYLPLLDKLISGNYRSFSP